MKEPEFYCVKCGEVDYPDAIEYTYQQEVKTETIVSQECKLCGARVFVAYEKTPPLAEED